MEIPIPNFYFMGIQFVHLLALSIWVGGIVIVQTVVAPALSQGIQSSRTAGLLLGNIFGKFDKITLYCSGALITTGIIKFWRWENLTPWNLMRYLAIFVMSSNSLYTTLKISPQLDRVSLAGSPESSLNLSSLKHLHKISAGLTSINLVCGVTALLMA